MLKELPKNTFPKAERLSNKIEIDRLFKQGQTLFVYPFKVIFSIHNPAQEVPIQVLFSIPKRIFKRAITRNLLRRRAKEVYRLGNHDLKLQLLEKDKSITILFIYADKKILLYPKIEKAIHKIFKKLSEQL